MDEMLMIYIEDLKDNTLALNEALLSSGTATESKERINHIFRVAHTIKGNSATMEFHNIEKVMHRMEDILYEVREGDRSMSKEIESTLFCCHDFLEDCADALVRDGHDRNVEIKKLMTLIEKLEGGANGGSEGLDNAAGVTAPFTDTDMDTFQASFDEELIELIEINVKRGLIPYVLRIKIDERSEVPGMRAYLAFQKIEDYGTLLHSVPERYSEEDLLNVDLPPCYDMCLLVLLSGNIEELADEIGTGIDIASVNYMQFDLARIKGLGSDDKSVTAAVETGSASQTSAKGEMIRVPSDKIDKLIDMLGELTILHAQIEQNYGDREEEGSAGENTLQRTGKIVREIQRMSLSLRMVEIKPILHRLTRIVRDTSLDLGKDVRVFLEGESTEIDKTVADRIFDPLMHVVRNAVSHGIEDKKERQKTGKPETGRIDIRAYKKRDHVYIEVSDDGRGLDPERILAKAKELGIANPEQLYSDSEINKFIFAPGFSTQKEINKISGRGVGMNVVEDEISKMRGRVDIRSEKDKGTTFCIKIPMNLSIMNGIIVDIHEGRYIVPTVSINEIIIPKEEQWVRVNNHVAGVHIRENIVPVIDSYRMLGYKDGVSVDSFESLMVLEYDGNLLGLPVDGIAGRQEIVSKKLGSQFEHLPYAAGASILGDGKVSVILDVDALFSMVTAKTNGPSGQTELI